MRKAVPPSPILVSVQSRRTSTHSTLQPLTTAVHSVTAPPNFSTPKGLYGMGRENRRRKPTYTPCPWSSWRCVCFSESMTYRRSDCSPFQLVTGKMPFPELIDSSVVIMVLKGKRPPKPRHFDAPGITPAVWKIAKKCWHEKARERPDVNAVLQDLEGLANPGPSMCTHQTRSYME
jgi:hypothetical protein